MPDENGGGSLDGQLVEEREREGQILSRRGPAAVRDADAAVLEVPGRDPGVAERLAEVAGVDQVVGRLPVAAMEHERERERPFAGRNAQVAELERLGSVCNAHVRRGRRRVGEDLRAVSHQATGAFQTRITGSSRS